MARSFSRQPRALGDRERAVISATAKFSEGRASRAAGATSLRRVGDNALPALPRQVLLDAAFGFPRGLALPGEEVLLG